MNAPNERIDLSAGPVAIARDWGWYAPPEDVLEMASKSAAARKLLVGEILVSWDLITAQKRDELLASKPDEIETLTYIAERESSRVQPIIVEQVLALKNGYPFYESLNVFSAHDAMEDADVFKRCESLDAVLMLIENERAVLIFHEHAALQRYSTNGRTARAEDPIIARNKGHKPFLAVGSRDDISSIIQHFSRIADGGKGDEKAGSVANVWRVRSDDSQRTPEERDLARIIDHAVNEGASDIALIPQDSGALEVYIRKFGILMPAFKGAKEGKDAKKTVMAPAIATRAINFLQSQSGANPHAGWLRLPGDGNLRYRSSTADAELRISIIPLNRYNDFKQLRSTSIRIFGKHAGGGSNAVDLQQLQVPDHILMHLRDVISMKQGAIIVSGPLNQGKSTTIAALLAEHYRIYGFTQKRVSLEEPIERDIPGTLQFQPPMWIEDPAERFNVMLRGFKRHDFNVMFMGEIRDANGADFGVRFASSGQLFLTTIHASNSISAVDVLQEMVKFDLRFQQIESMSVSACQRLVPTVCEFCGTPNSKVTAEERRLFQLNLDTLGERFDIPETFTRADPNGCEHCMFGSNGSVPVIELLPFPRKVKDAWHALRRGDDVQSRQIIADARLSTLMGEGLKYVSAGKVDLRSILFL